MTRKSIQEVYLQAILNGTKKAEGRMCSDFWNRLLVNTEIIFVSGTREVRVRIDCASITKGVTFEEALRTSVQRNADTNLMPGRMEEEIIAEYLAIYKTPEKWQGAYAFGVFYFTVLG